MHLEEFYAVKMAAQEASTPFAGTLEERLNKLRGLLDYLPPELPSPAKAEDSRYYPGSSDTWKQLFALERFVRKVCISADNKPLRIAERGAGIMDLIRQIQKCFRTWDSSEFVDKLIAAVYRTCEDGDVKVRWIHLQVYFLSSLECKNRHLYGIEFLLKDHGDDHFHHLNYLQILSPLRHQRNVPHLPSHLR